VTRPKPRILSVLEVYGQLSETYVQTEIRALAPDYDIEIVALNHPVTKDAEARPFRVLADPAEILEAVQAYRPDVLHSHWLFNAALLLRLARASGTPFTLRAHSFDAMIPRWLGLRARLAGRYRGTLRTPRHLLRIAPILNDELCLGVLAFPYTRPLLERVGVRGDKIRDCFPVVDFARFHDRSPNGDGVLNVGAITPKKRMTDFVELAASLPGMPFDLHPLPTGHGEPIEADLRERNRRRGNPVAIRAPVAHADMPAVYKRHRWLVYTASRRYDTVGWPLALAEAMAAGTGVCMVALRPDLEQYLGGAGFTYRSVAEAREILRRPFPEEMRERAFVQARKSDIALHKHRLTELWAKAGAWPGRAGGLPSPVGSPTG
jgi:glycosyltransferase involved in cell wall biosynthesis